MKRLRLAKEADIQDLIRLGEQWFHPLWHKEEKAKILAAELQSPQHLVYVVEEDEGIIAFCDIWQWQDWLTRKKMCNFLHVYVDERHRGKGVGTFMLKEIFETNDWDFAFIDMKSEEAEKLYLKAGFAPNPRRKWMERYLHYPTES